MDFRWSIQGPPFQSVGIGSELLVTIEQIGTFDPETAQLVPNEQLGSPSKPPVLIQGNKDIRAAELTQVRLVVEQIDSMFTDEPDKQAIADASKTWDEATWNQIANVAQVPPLTA